MWQDQHRLYWPNMSPHTTNLIPGLSRFSVYLHRKKAYIWTRTIKLSIKLKGLSVALNSSCSVFEEFTRFLCLCAAQGYYKNQTKFHTNVQKDQMTHFYEHFYGCYKTHITIFHIWSETVSMCKQPHFTVDGFYENKF